MMKIVASMALLILTGGAMAAGVLAFVFGG